MSENIENIKEVEGISLDTYAGKALLSVRTKFRGIAGDSGFLLVNLMDIVNFMLLHDKFANEGIFITEENKEEKYIEILERDDPKLLEDLEKYIDCLDKIAIIQRRIDEYNEVVTQVKDVNDLDDVDSINNIVKGYLKK